MPSRLRSWAESARLILKRSAGKCSQIVSKCFLCTRRMRKRDRLKAFVIDGGVLCAQDALSNIKRKFS